MEFIADFHIHSKYSRATSRDMDIRHLADWAKLKGITLMGTGDFTHHLWLEELKNNLTDTGNGLFKHKDVHFILTAEVSSIYSKNNRTYRIHNLIFAPSFAAVDRINDALGRRGNLASDGRPILGVPADEIARIVFDIDENCMIVPGHIWTPWFSLFGSMSGFDRIEDCFEKQTDKIFALETGLSSDPAMNWRLSGLDRFSLISNSDSHSPAKIGREANVFDCDLDYKTIREALRTKNKKKFLYTIEFFPEEGKYHYDGHRLCNVVFSPAESKQHNNICPKCRKPLTIGVMNRVDQLADRPDGFVPESAIPFKHLVPLSEIIAESKGIKAASAASEKEYFSVVATFGSEFNILLKASAAELTKGLQPRLAQGVLRMREGKVSASAGYDGEYGRISVFGKDEPQQQAEQQLRLF
jgi:uncharacterized protein (TIGR00375 family)